MDKQPAPRNRPREAAATLVLIGAAALIGVLAGGRSGGFLVASVTFLAALFWTLTSDWAAARLPYHLARRAPQYPPELLDAFVKGRQARRVRRRRLLGKIREGTELLNEAERIVELGAPVSTAPLFGSLDQRVERWTKEVEKLLEGANDAHADAFHRACLVLPAASVTGDRRLVDLMRTRLVAVESVANQLDQEA